MKITDIISILEQKVVILNKFLSNANFNGDLSEITKLELELQETEQTIFKLRSTLNNI